MDYTFLHGKKILLVDDEPELLTMVSGILRDEGFEHILSAASVKEAVTTAKEVQMIIFLNPLCHRN